MYNKGRRRRRRRRRRRYCHRAKRKYIFTNRLE
jgi:hypothetical protein